MQFHVPETGCVQLHFYVRKLVRKNEFFPKYMKKLFLLLSRKISRPCSIRATLLGPASPVLVHCDHYSVREIAFYGLVMKDTILW